MTQLGFYFNQEECIGCKVCQVACCDRNNLSVETLYRTVHSFEAGSYPNAQLFHYSASCNHCADPACVKNCPTSAMYKADDGTVVHDDSLCIGCGSCKMACPYSIPAMLDERGIAGKCDSCKSLRDAGQNPACVDACPMRALDFGDLNELRAKYGDNLVDELPILPSPSFTSPSLLVKQKASAQNVGDAREVML